MGEKYLVTNFDRDELVSLIREAFKEELKSLLKKNDYDDLLTRKEAAQFLKISLRTICKYQDDGRIQHYRIGRAVYFKKGELMKALEMPLKYQHRRF